MSGIEEIPSGSRMKAYDYCNATWRSIAVQRSGEVVIARGEHILTMNLRATSASGGMALGSSWTNSGLGNIDRINIKCPYVICSGTSRYNLVRNSGVIQGLFIGGASGTPYMPYSMSGGISCISGDNNAFWLAPGDEKTLYVQALNEVRVVGYPSGYPCQYIAETIVC